MLEPLRGLRFAGDVRAVDEGRVVLADEPLLEVTTPLPQAQLVETAALNALTYQVAVASKAVRCGVAAQGRPVIEFGLRRTHGAEAGMAVARATAIAGFAATSNVGAAMADGLRATGTMAHSYVQALPSEYDAFSSFAADFPTARRSSSTPTTPPAASMPRSASSPSMACRRSPGSASTAVISLSRRAPPGTGSTPPA
jgi:nicotinate phosphoribosyltransferase